MTNFYNAKSARSSGRGLADVSSGILASGYCFYRLVEVDWCGQRGGSQASGSQEGRADFGYGLALSEGERVLDWSFNCALVVTWTSDLPLRIL